MGEMKTIIKVPVRPVALMVAVLSAILGLLRGIILAIVIATGVSVTHHAFHATTMLGSGAGLQAFAIIGGLVFGFIGGYIIVAIVALIYNWLAPRIGGIKLELQ